LRSSAVFSASMASSLCRRSAAPTTLLLISDARAWRCASTTTPPISLRFIDTKNAAVDARFDL